MGPTDRPLRSHRGTILIFLGIGSSTTPQRRRPNPNSLREFLVYRFNRIDILAVRLRRLDTYREIEYFVAFNVKDIGFCQLIDDCTWATRFGKNLVNWRNIMGHVDNF